MALITGKSVQQAPKQVPANPRLYNMIRTQADTRFQKESPAKAHWMHSRYLQMGGRFVGSEKQVDPRMRDYVEEAKEKAKKKQLQQISKPVGKGLIKGEARR
jgi:hypothetical protein